jgi:hypothetical protein
VLGGEVSLEADLRVALDEITDELEEARVADGREGDAQLAANRLVDLLHAGLGALHGVEYEPRVRVEGDACVREREGARGPPQQAHSETFFEARQPAPDGGAGDPELGGRAREGLRVDDSREGQQLGGLEGLQHLDRSVANQSN